MHKVVVKDVARMPGRNPAVPLSKNEHLLRWVEKMAELAKPAAIHWVDGSQEENDALRREMVAARNVHQAQRKTLARLLLRPLGRQRRRSRRRPHLHLLAFQRRRRPHQQLGKSLRDAQKAEEPLQRRDARPHHVCAALQHGPVRLADVADRRATHRFALRGREYAHHGAHRVARVSANR